MLKTFRLTVSFLDLLDLPVKDDFEPTDLQTIENGENREYFESEFTKPEYKTLESRLPVFIELGNIEAAHRLSSENLTEFEISGIVSDALRFFYFGKLGSQTRKFCDDFIWTLSEKCGFY